MSYIRPLLKIFDCQLESFITRYVFNEWVWLHFSGRGYMLMNGSRILNSENHFYSLYLSSSSSLGQSVSIIFLSVGY